METIINIPGDKLEALEKMARQQNVSQANLILQAIDDLLGKQAVSCPHLLEEILGKKGEVLKFAQMYGIHNIRVFGSAVRGEATSKSDIDLLVDLGENADFLGFKIDLEAVFNRPVDVVTEKMLHWAIRDRVMQEMIVL